MAYYISLHYTKINGKFFSPGEIIPLEDIRAIDNEKKKRLMEQGAIEKKNANGLQMDEPDPERTMEDAEGEAEEYEEDESVKDIDVMAGIVSDKPAKAAKGKGKK